MFEKVIVGVDGEEGGRDAIALAKTLQAHHGELILAHVYLAEPLAWRGSSTAYEEMLREDAAKLLTSAREEADVDAALSWHAASNPGRGLHELAEQVGADLLVVGSSRRGHLGRVRSTNDTSHSLNGAPCPVAVAPAGYGAMAGGIHKIGVAYDGSPQSRYALAFAREFAEARSATLAACQVLYFPARTYVGPALPDRGQIDEMLNDVGERLRELGDIDAHARYGDPAEELSAFSDTVDLLLVGSRGYGPFGRLLYGSTAHRLARSARCPLLVLTRKPDRADDDEAQPAGSSTATAG